MDQFAEACGVAGSAVLLDCRSLEWRPIPLPDDVRLVVCHTGSPRHLDGSAYNERREPVRGGRRRDRPGRPAVATLRDVTPVPPRRGATRLDPVAYRRARARRERERSGWREVVTALAAGDLASVGVRSPPATPRCATGSRSARRSSTRWSRSPRRSPGVVAARMTGAGFGGCTVNLVRPEAVEALRARRRARLPGADRAHADRPARSTPSTAPAACADDRRGVSVRSTSGRP